MQTESPLPVRDAEEQMVLVDADDRVIGTEGKLAVHRIGALHRAFSVIVWDRSGRQLIQKRARGKYHSGGLWTNACCGHPRPGEDIAAAALRRLEEEMGIACPLESLGTIHYRAELDGGLWEHELVHVFRGTYEGLVAPHPAEVENYCWARLENLRDSIAEDPKAFSVWFRQYVAAQWPMALAAPEGLGPD
jgi:isopentenyl-diphosphate delta-isomerase